MLCHNAGQYKKNERFNLKLFIDEYTLCGRSNLC